MTLSFYWEMKFGVRFLGFFQEHAHTKEILITFNCSLSPWIFDVEIELIQLFSLKAQGSIDWFEFDYQIKSINLP